MVYEAEFLVVQVISNVLMMVDMKRYQTNLSGSFPPSWVRTPSSDSPWKWKQLSLFLSLWLHLDLTSGTRAALRAAGGHCSRLSSKWSCVQTEKLQMAFISSPWPSHLTSQLMDQAGELGKWRWKKKLMQIKNINCLSQEAWIERTGWLLRMGREHQNALT